METKMPNRDHQIEPITQQPRKIGGNVHKFFVGANYANLNVLFENLLFKCGTNMQN